MAIAELELRRETFVHLVQAILSGSPIPAPWFAILGRARLLRHLTWIDPIPGVAPPGGGVPPGALPVRAAVTAAHVSLHELAANPDAPGLLTDLTAWLFVTAEPGRIRIALTRLEAAGLAPQTFATPLLIGEQAFELEDAGEVHGGAILMDGEVVTIRLAVGADDNLSAPAANRLLATDGDQWLIRVSGDVFADMVRSRLQDALKSLPDGTTIEEGPGALWSALLGQWGGTSGPWGVIGSVDLEKKNACAGVTLSITVSVTLSLAPDIPTERVNLILHVSSNVSDWDVFRCWLSTGGITTLFLAVVTNVLVAALHAVSGLVLLAEVVRVDAGKEVKAKPIGGGFTQVDSGETYATYSGSIGMPAFPTGSIEHAQVGPDGLVISGRVVIAGIARRATFEPEGGPLTGVWSGWYSCREHQWKTSYDLASVLVRDFIEAFGAPIRQNGVAIFPTSGFRPVGFMPVLPGSSPAAPGAWIVDAPSWPMAGPLVTPRRTGPPAAGEHLYFFLHTSAGLRRFEIGPVPSPEAGPSAQLLGMYEANCRQLTRHWTRLHQIEWLVDPPPFDYGIRPLRQWMLAFRNLAPGSRVTIHQRGGPGAPLARTFEDSAGVIELVTPDGVGIAVEHGFDAQSNAEVHIEQRWLLPTRLVRLPGPPQGLAPARLWPGRPGRSVAVTVEGRTLTLGTEGLVAVDRPAASEDAIEPGRRPPAALLSVSMTTGQVAAVLGDQLVLAVPWGGPHRAGAGWRSHAAAASSLPGERGE